MWDKKWVRRIDRTVSDLGIRYYTIDMAERVGFEPTVRFPVHTLSKRAPSTTRTSLRLESTICERSVIRVSQNACRILLARDEMWIQRFMDGGKANIAEIVS